MNKKSKLSVASTITSANNLFAGINRPPIKIVDNKSGNKTASHLYNAVVEGDGISAAVLAKPILKSDKHPKRAWHVLLDSGSDGDLAFVNKKVLKNIRHENRFSPMKWTTSNGAFTTTKVGILDLVFPEFSGSKRFSLRPDIQVIPEDEEPMFDLIIGVESLQRFGAILNFGTQCITLDQIEMPMQPLERFLRITDRLRKSNRSGMKFPPINELEPISTRDARKRTIEILDAKYEKADLPAVVSDNCGHLSPLQQSKLLELLIKFEDLFDGTLGDFKTQPVRFHLKDGERPYHGKPYPIPQSRLAVIKKEVKRLVDIGVLKRQPESEWGSPAFVIPKSNQTVRFLGNFREVNE